MSKKILISLSALILLPIITWSAYTGFNILAQTSNSDAGLIDNDTWELGADFTFQAPNIDSIAYNTRIATLSGKINTTLFGDFTFSELNFIKTTNTNCLTGTTYSLSGTIHSVEAWGDMDFVENDSYYCPYDDSWLGKLNSGWLGNKLIGNIVGTGTGVIGASFNIEEKLLVQGLIGTSNTINNSGAVVNTEHSNTQTSQVLQISADKAKLTESINKNIALITRNITPINELNSSNYPTGVDSTGDWITNLNNTTNELYYFNYEGKEESDFSNEKNKGKILKISNSTWDSSDFRNYQVGVNGHKTVIVKGGNIYIDADIYNVDNNSLLVLIAKRDSESTKKQNGGNIYINPYVTNIDAVIIAEGSIINFDGNTVITDDDSLRNQLYIYGSTFTKNSIGSTVSPYGSDGYIEYGKDSTIGAEKYDLTKLRTFNLIASSSDSSVVCNNNDNLLVPRLNSTMAVKEYAWAGKRKCFNEPTVSSTETNPSPTASTNISGIQLRGSNLFNPLIIEYNPIVQTNPPYILKNNN